MVAAVPVDVTSRDFEWDSIALAMITRRISGSVAYCISEDDDEDEEEEEMADKERPCFSSSTPAPAPADAVAANAQNNRIQLGNIGVQNNIVIQNGQFNIVGGAAPANLGGFKILDAEGKTLLPSSSSTSMQVGPGGTKRSVNVTYPANSKAPFKIIYEGGTPIAVEVPFSLKLIPLQ